MITKFNKFITENKYNDRYEEWTEKNGELPIEQSLGFNEFDTSFDWIEMFGGELLLSTRHIRSGFDLLKALNDGRITIQEIDIATEGEHGQVGDIPFSQTTIAKEIVIPYLENEKVTESLDSKKLGELKYGVCKYINGEYKIIREIRAFDIEDYYFNTKGEETFLIVTFNDLYDFNVQKSYVLTYSVSHNVNFFGTKGDFSVSGGIAMFDSKTTLNKFLKSFEYVSIDEIGENICEELVRDIKNQLPNGNLNSEKNESYSVVKFKDYKGFKISE